MKTEFLWTMFWIGCFSRTVNARGTRPNIVFFLVDDLGWNDLGINGQTEIPTPNMDALAYDGITLKNYYTAPLCTPSRASIMTGRYPQNTGLQYSVIRIAQPQGLPLDIPIIPQVLEQLGYQSHLVGKWHLGSYRSEYLPTRRGFDTHYGFRGSNSDYVTYLTSDRYNSTMFDQYTLPIHLRDPNKIIELTGYDFYENKNMVTNGNGEYLTDLYSKRAVEVIKKRDKTKPLFLFASHHGVHRGNLFKPITAPTKYTKYFPYIRDKNRRNFAGALTAIDQALGVLVQTLAEERMLSDTIIVLTSDNGSPDVQFYTGNGGSNFPLRAQKGTVFEGGVKVSGIIWSASIKKPGRIWDGLMHASDWMPTLYRAAGGNPTCLKRIDGIDLWDAINKDSKSLRTEVFLLRDEITNITGFRWGNYKLVQGQNLLLDGYYGTDGRTKPNVSGKLQSRVSRTLAAFRGRPIVKGRNFPIEIKCLRKEDKIECRPDKEPCLFDIVNDACEYRNIGREKPEIVRSLQARVATLIKRNIPALNRQMDYRANPRYHNNFWVSWKDDVPLKNEYLKNRAPNSDSVYHSP